MLALKVSLLGADDTRMTLLATAHHLRAVSPLVGAGPTWCCSCGWVFHDPQAAALHTTAQLG